MNQNATDERGYPLWRVLAGRKAWETRRRNQVLREALAKGSPANTEDVEGETVTDDMILLDYIPQVPVPPPLPVRVRVPPQEPQRLEPTLHQLSKNGFLRR